jgi:predicted RNA-binding protein YlxR (DUF448 family)
MLMRSLIIFNIIFLLSSTVYARKSSFSEEETKFLKMLEKQKIDLNKIESGKTVETVIKKVEKKKMEKKKKMPVYVPAPIVRDPQKNGYMIDRDSTKIKEIAISYKDAVNINLCYSAGVTIALDETYQDELQRVIKDDDEFIDAKQFDNNRGVYVKLKQPVQEGKFWESALRLVTKSNDKTILLNIIGTACPRDGANKYPKVYYLKEKYGLIGVNSNVMTPEDTIIQMSEGFPRINKNVIRVYDMVASSNSNWVVLGIEVQYRNPDSEETKILFKTLDNFQINPIRVKQEHLKTQSLKATKDNGFPTLRFNLKVNINKDYILNNRYLYLMTLDKATKHYQYKKIDLRDYFISLINRGFNI